MLKTVLFFCLLKKKTSLIIRLVQCLLFYLVINSKWILWCSDGATSTFSLLPRGKICKSVKFESESVKMRWRRCGGEDTKSWRQRSDTTASSRDNCICQKEGDSRAKFLVILLYEVNSILMFQGDRLW